MVDKNDLEESLESRCVLLAEKDGWFVRKLKWVGRVGAPDRIFIKGGRAVFVEFKRPNGRGKRATAQIRERERIQGAGGECIFCTNEEYFRRVMKIDATLTG